jgi:hypothetical protein
MSNIGGFSEGCFAIQDHYLYRLNSETDCKVLDVFNIEFFESIPFVLDSTLSDRLMGSSPCHSF